MSLHAFIAYLKYTWKAKGRHGTHSPFVYDLVDHVLLDKGPLKKQYNIHCPGLELKYENLLCRIAAYYNYDNIVCLPGPINNQPSMFLINTEPGTWLNLLAENIQLLQNDSMIVVSDIHKTTAHSSAWRKLATYNHVRMSIDLFGIGVLLFKQEFKERQHFTLKY